MGKGKVIVALVQEEAWQATGKSPRTSQPSFCKAWFAGPKTLISSCQHSFISD